MPKPVNSKQPTLFYGTERSARENVDFRRSERSCCPSYQSTIQGNLEKPFVAKPRPKPKWTAGDYAILALKVLFFPLTAIHWAISSICSLIAFRIGVGSTREIDEYKRGELRKLRGEEISFITEDNIQLEGMYFKNPRAISGAQTVLICSGSHASYEEYAVPMVDALLKLGHHAMVFNYRGFGESRGSPSEEGFNLDTDAAYQYLQSVTDSSDKITVWGYSMGAAPAADLAANRGVKLVLDRYFSSMKDVASDQGGFIAKGIFGLGGAGFDIKEKIKKAQKGIFLARGSSDLTMKPYHEEYLKSALRENPRASFLSVHSAHVHNSYADLWFHPKNTSNRSQRDQLQKFLVS